MSRKTSSRRPRLKRMITALFVLALIISAVYILTPSLATYYGVPQDTVLASLEVPALEQREALILHTGYSMTYDEEHEMARWVAYHLDRDELYGLHERRDDFRPDDAIPTGSAELSDYRGSGYDRGHLIPAADATWSEQAMSDTFLLSNMAPQEPMFNRGIWADLEATVRNFADELGGVYVTTGGIYESEYPKTIGDNAVSVPDAFFKAILSRREGETDAIGFILPHEPSEAPLGDFVVTINTIEEQTGLDLFPLLDDKIEENVESQVDSDLWPFDAFRITREERSAYVTQIMEREKEQSAGGREKTSVAEATLHLLMEIKRAADPYVHDLRSWVNSIFTQ
ncbi:MAG: DNA/RNA non-specific endonuclease [Sphaerochaetaceae bacterium]|nr:DNA/RNA non-specific endonuclease [Sphaerochaetaceae bacterium]